MPSCPHWPASPSPITRTCWPSPPSPKPGWGTSADKTLKNSVASAGVYAQLAGRSGTARSGSTASARWPRSPARSASSFGLVPATHPVATFIFKALIALKGRNAIILSPSRRARQRVATGRRADPAAAARRGRAGRPRAVAGGSQHPHAATAALMSHRHVGLVLATGGRAMVQAAYRSGKPAIGVGPGNAPVLITRRCRSPARRAQHRVEQVVRQRFDLRRRKSPGGRSGAHAVLIAELVRQGAAVLTPAESARFRDAAVDPGRSGLRRRSSARMPRRLPGWRASSGPYSIKLLVIPTESVTADELPRRREARAGRQPVHRVRDVDEGLEGVPWRCSASMEPATPRSSIRGTSSSVGASRQRVPCQPHPGELARDAGI